MLFSFSIWGTLELTKVMPRPFHFKSKSKVKISFSSTALVFILKHYCRILHVSESPRALTSQSAVFFLWLLSLKAYLCWSQEKTPNRAESRVAPLEEESADVIQSPSSDSLMCHDGLFHVAAASVLLTDILMAACDALIKAAANYTHTQSDKWTAAISETHLTDSNTLATTLQPLILNILFVCEGCLMFLSPLSLIFLFCFILFWAVDLAFYENNLLPWC